MVDEVSLYRARAEAERAIAAETSLPNVRERSERSAKAWSEMADRAERIVTERRARETAVRTPRLDQATSNDAPQRRRR